MTYQKNIFISNLKFLAKSKGINLGEIERQVGVSAGYISRLGKDGNKGNPPIDFVVNVADVLGISVDALVSVNFEEATETEIYLATFIEKLISETTTKDMPWKKERESLLNSITTAEQQRNINHPLFQIFQDYYNDPETGYPCEYENVRYISSFVEPDSIKVFYDSYNVEIANDALLYLICVSVIPNNNVASSVTEYEMYMVKQYDATPICSTSFREGRGALNDLIKALHDVAEESCKHAKVNPQVRNIIDSFIKRTEDSDDDFLF